MGNGGEEQAIDVRVRLALLEQALVHGEQVAGLHRDMLSARSTALERQIATIADQQAWASGRFQVHGGAIQEAGVTLQTHSGLIQSLSSRMDQHDRLAERFRYAGAAALALLAAAGHLAPESLGKFVKALAVLPP